MGMRQTQADKNHTNDCENKQLVADIRYLNLEIQEQIKILQGSLQGSSSAETHAEVIRTLGELHARVNIIERALKQCDIELSDRPDLLRVGAVVHADDFIGFNNLLTLQKNSAGSKFCWTGEKRCTVFSFALERSRSMQLEIGIVALMKPAFSRKMMIVIDGETLRHKFKKQGEIFIASITLPVSGRLETEIRILLPETLSHADIGSGKDAQKKGLAISFLSFQPVPTGLFG